MKSPTAPPPLNKMAARKAAIEAQRVLTFATWKAALEAARGNITQAGAATGKSRSWANKLTKKLGLTEYATKLRGGVGAGRPKIR